MVASYWNGALSFVFDNYISPEKAIDFMNNLQIFRIGMSWGGVNSLAVVYPDLIRPTQDFAGRIVRLNIGLEDVDDLISDLEQAFRTIGWLFMDSIPINK